MRLQGPFETADGLVGLSLLQEDEPQIVVSLRMIRLQRDGSPVGLGCLLQAAPFFQHHPEIVVGLGMFGM
jgi:hypothetical protein